MYLKTKIVLAVCKDKLDACFLLRLGKGIELEKRDKSESSGLSLFLS